MCLTQNYNIENTKLKSKWKNILIFENIVETLTNFSLKVSVLKKFAKFKFTS